VSFPVFCLTTRFDSRKLLNGDGDFSAVAPERERDGSTKELLRFRASVAIITMAISPQHGVFCISRFDLTIALAGSFDLKQSHLD
jgi:hypothetical protein